MSKQAATTGNMRTANATSGGGTEGALAVIKSIGFVDQFNYGGTIKEKQAALQVEFEIEDMDKPWDQNYTLGKASRFEVLNDGDSIKGALNEKCVAFLFLSHIEAAAEASGIDLNDLLPVDDDGLTSVRPLEGRRVRLTNVKFTPLSGDPKDVIVIKEFIADAPKGAKGKTSSRAAAPASSDDLELKTAAAIQALFDEDTTKLKKGDLANLLHAEHRKDADIKAMMNLCFKESFLADEDRPWVYDKKKGTLTAAD